MSSICGGRRVDNSCDEAGSGIPGVIVKNQGINIPNTPDTTLNFVGPGVTASDGGGGVAIINIPGVVIGSRIAPYTLLKDKTTVFSTNWMTVAYFPWLNSRYGSYMNGVVIFRTIVADRDLSIQLIDTTTSVVLGSAAILGPTTISTSFILSSIPTSDDTIELQVMKSDLGGVNPVILGCNLEFNF